MTRKPQVWLVKPGVVFVSSLQGKSKSIKITPVLELLWGVKPSKVYSPSTRSLKEDTEMSLNSHNSLTRFPCCVQRYEQDVRQRMGQGGIFLGGRGWMEVQLKDTIGAWKQHTTPDHFSHDAANRPDINWKMKWQTTKLACGTEKQTEKQHQQQEQKGKINMMWCQVMCVWYMTQMKCMQMNALSNLGQHPTGLRKMMIILFFFFWPA